MAKFILSAFADEAGKSLQEQIAALQRNNIKFMEIRAVDGVNISKIPLSTVAEYKKHLDAAGIRVLTIGSPIGKVGLKDDYHQHLGDYLHVLGAAKILGAERIRMFSVFTKDTDPALCRDEIMAKMDEMLRIAEGTGIALYHENEKGIYGDIAERVIDLMDAFGGRMNFIFDPANFIQCGEKPLEIYPKLKERINYFHIKDARLSDGRVVPAGQGDGDIAAILKDFAQTNDNVMLTVEPHLKSFEGLKDHTSMGELDETIYKDNNESFDVAVNSIKSILESEGLYYE